MGRIIQLSFCQKRNGEAESMGTVLEHEKDRSSLPNVYNRIDKVHLCEEQRSDSNFTENKAKFAAVQPGLNECCDGESTEELPADKADLRDLGEDGESAAKCCSTLQTQAIMESVLLLRDNNKPLDVCSQDANQQTDCSHHKSGEGTSEVVYVVIDKTDTTENKQGVLINETHAKESQLFPQTTEQLINGHGTDKEDPVYGDSTGSLSWDKNNDSSSVLNCGTSELSRASCLNNQNTQPKIEPMKVAQESNTRFCEDSSLSNQIEKSNQSLFVEDTSKHCEDIGRPSCGTTAENDSCIGQGKILCSLPSNAPNTCKEPVKNMHLQSASDHKQDCQGSRSNLENTDVSEVKNLLGDRREMCPLVREEDEKLEGSNISDINYRRGLLADGHSVNICQVAESGEPLSVEKENIIVGNNLPVNFTLEESSGQTVQKLFTKPVGPSTEIAKTNSQREKITNMSDSSAKRLCLSRANPWNSQPSNKPSSNLGNCTLPYLSSRDTCTKAEIGSSIKRLAFDNLSMNVQPVPRKDHSAEWNAIAQTFHNSPFPTEDFNVIEKQNRSFSDLAAARSTGLNIAQTKAQHDSGQVKAESSSRFSIQDQINAIETFLQYHSLRGSKRKLEDCNETKEPKENSTSQGVAKEM
ncbi:uncharacterized protein [Aquarana catesbeiana]|uniref:uncharacterized protein n=1 Tax=Aquarana catesbeiana TaxID=8400 RepID=UPI003CCA0E0E